MFCKYSLLSALVGDTAYHRINHGNLYRFFKITIVLKSVLLYGAVIALVMKEMSAMDSKIPSTEND